jgi:hypothetical protein
MPINENDDLMAQLKILAKAFNMRALEDPSLPPISLGIAAICRDENQVVSAQFEAEKFNLEKFCGEYDHSEGDDNE